MIAARPPLAGLPALGTTPRVTVTPLPASPSVTKRYGAGPVFLITVRGSAAGSGTYAVKAPNAGRALGVLKLGVN